MPEQQADSITVCSKKGVVVSTYSAWQRKVHWSGRSYNPGYSGFEIKLNNFN